MRAAIRFGHRKARNFGALCGLQCLFLLFVMVFAVAQVPQASPDSGKEGAGSSLSLEQYRAELANWSSRVSELQSSPQNSVAMLHDLPEAWQLDTGHERIRTSTKFLRGALEDFQRTSWPDMRQSILKDLGFRLDAMQRAAADYSSATNLPADAHKRLEQILAAREFARLQGPTALELLWERIKAWVDRQLAKFSMKLPEAKDSGPLFAWCVIAVACCIFGVYLYRKSREIELDTTREIIPFAPSEKSWRAWLAEARDQAARENWREAIHFAFWSGVSRLESEGAWRPDPGRTAREYLAALGSTNPARPAFASLLRRFESAWYAGRPAFAQDFESMLADLEKIGCR
jgi:hypothetical protein